MAHAMDQESAPEVHKVEIQGDSAIDQSTLRGLLQTKESAGGISKFLYNLFGEALGSPPVYYDTATVESDDRRLKDYYQQEGFYNAVVHSQVHIDTSNNEADVLFRIQENQRSLVDSIRYIGLDTLSLELRKIIFKEPLIYPGQPYEVSKANAEIARILVDLTNNGYMNARFDDSSSAAYRFLSTNNIKLVFTFSPGRFYFFDGVHFHGDSTRPDITPNLALRQLDFETGEIYDREKVTSSEMSLNRLEIFESVRIDHPPVPDSLGRDTVSMDVYAHPRVRNELAPELVVSDEGGYFNLGTGLGFANRNFFGDARIFTAHGRILTQDIQRWKFGSIFGGAGLKDPSVRGILELELQVFQPYLFTRSLSGRLTATLSAEKQQDFILSILQNKIGVVDKFATYTTGFFIWTLERVSPEILGDTAVAQAQLSTRQQEGQRQFNSILTATLQRDKTNDIFSPSDGFFHSLTLEESGLLPKVLSRNRSSSLPFTEYYKVALLGRWYFDLTNTRFNILATKLSTGFQQKYGQSKYLNVQIPLDHRFYCGGSNSVRGWQAHDLGAMADPLVGFGGNFLTEGSIEMRVNQFRGFGKFAFLDLNKIWTVYFMDFGNVWSDAVNFKPNEIASAAGIGLRYDTFFGPFRIDYGFRTYDPKERAGHQTIFKKKFLSETLASGVLHFGIGQAF